MRTYLSPGTVISVTDEVATRKVYIEKVIGEGASCIVYDAFFVDVPGVKERCRLKECYPLDAKIERQGGRLIWYDPAERVAAHRRFQTVRQRSIEMRNNPVVGNHITKSGYYENGDNCYLIMDLNHGQTLDKENSRDINRILKIALELTRVVGKIHDFGYRNLDLKPDNILVSADPEPKIWLFDLDSLVPLDNSHTVSYSYSKGWAAPELVQGKISSLCNATDLYSVGAVLFSKIMGRSVTNDDIGLFAEWDFDSEIFDNVNPQLQRYLREIFKQTLSASVKRRYQNAEELASALEQAIGEMGKPYILSNIPDNSANFIGRDQELKDIRGAFLSGKRIVFLSGIGGIGKSELAKQYGNLQKSSYDVVIYTEFEGSINSLLLDIEIQDFEGDDTQKIKCLNRLLDRRALLVIDNVDTDAVPNFKMLERLKCDILITSRLDWREYSFPVVEIASLAEKDQVDLFIKEFGSELNSSQKDAVLSILSDIEGYTLLIPLIAKQMRKGHSSFDELATSIHNVGIKAASTGKVRHLKDGMALSGSVYGILSEVLNIANFSESEKCVMRSLALLSRYRIDQAEFLRWIGKEYTIQIDDLVVNSWVYRDFWRGNTVLSLHAVISELCIEELKPSLTNCWGIRDRIWLFADEFAQWHKNPTAYYFGGYAPTHIRSNIQYQFDSYVQIMQDILLKCDWGDSDNVFLWLIIIERVTNVISGEFGVFEHFLTFVIKKGLNILDEVWEPLPSVTYAALSLVAIALQQDNLEEALVLAQCVVKTIGSVDDPIEILFKMCFHFYQWICLRRLDFEAYWDMPGFYALAEFIRKQWHFVIEEEIIGFEDTSVCVLNNNSGLRDLCVDEAIAQAFEDFCVKISPEEIRASDKFLSYAPDAMSDIEMGSKAIDHVCKLYGFNTSIDGHMGNEQSLSAEEVELSKFVRIQQERVNDLLGCKVDNPMGIWLVMKPKIWSKAEKEGIHNKLLQIDTMLPVHIPAVVGRTAFAYDLAKMEAAFSYAYAVAGDCEKYYFHKSNLLMYYEFHIDGKCFLPCTISDIRSGLPGLASLVNLHGDVFPAMQALELLSNVINLMEKHHANKHIPVDSLFEVYEMALNLAEKAQDTAKIIHYQQRVNRLSSVYFTPKNKTK